MAISTVGTALANLGVVTTAWFRGLDKAQKKWVQFGAKVQVAGFRLGVAMTATFGALGAAVFKFGSEFERSFAGVLKTISKADRAKFGTKLREGILGIARDTPFAATELSRLARLSAQLGVESQNLLKFTETVAKLGVAAQELPAEEAATSLARILKITGEGTGNVGVLANVIARLGDEFATTEARILNFTTTTSGLAKVANISSSDMAALGAAFTSVVPGVELVGTQVSKLFTNIANATSSGGAKLRALNNLIGGDFKKAWEEDAASAVAKFLSGLNKVDEEGGNVFTVLEQLGLTNQRAAKAFLAAAGGHEQFTAALVTGRKEQQEQTKLNESMAVVMETVTEQVTILGNRLKEVFITIFDGFQPILMSFIDILKKAIDVLQWFGEVLAGLPEIVKLGILAVGAFGFALSGLLIATGSLISLFTALNLGTAISMFTSLSAKILGVEKAMVAAKFATLAWQAAAVGLFAYLGFQVGKILEENLDKFFKIRDAAGDIAAARVNERLESEKLQQKINSEIIIRDRLKQLMKEGVTLGINPYTASVKELWEESERLNRKTQETIKGTEAFTNVLKMDGAALREHVAGIIKETEEEKILAEATSFLSQEVTDLAFAKEVLAIKTELLGKELEKEAQFASSAADAFKELRLATQKMPEQTTKPAEFLTGPFQPGDNRILRGATGPIDTSDMNEVAMAMFRAEQRVRDLGGAIGETSALSEKLGDELITGTQGADDSMKEYIKALRSAKQIMGSFGISASSILGSMLTGTIALASQWDSLAADFKAGGFGVGGAIGQGDVAGAVSGSAAGVAGVLSATSQGSTGARTTGGALAGASAGAAVGGPIGAAVGAIGGALVGFFRGRAFAKVKKEIQGIVGTEVSDAVAEGIKDVSKKLGVSLGDATLLSLGDIIAEEGIDSTNLAGFQTAFTNLMQGVADETLPAKEGLAEMNEVFVQMFDHLRQQGPEGAVQIAAMVDQMRELGVVTDEVKEIMANLASEALGKLTPFFDILNEQFGEKGPFRDNMEAAEENVTALVAGFASAVQAAGGLAGAIALLPESFDELFKKFQELLGTENEAFNTLQQFYNFAKNNEEALGALEALGGALNDLIAIGVVNASTLDDFALAFKTQLDAIADGGELSKTALMAIAPQIAELLAAYEELGVKVPDWLQDVADKAAEAGASLAPPEDMIDILGGIRDVLFEIAVALGAAADEGDRFAGSLPGPGDVPSPGGPGGGDNAPGMQTGGFVPSTPGGRVIRIGEGTEGEFVTPASQMMRMNQGGGDGGTNVTMIIDSDVLGEVIANGTKNGTIRIHENSVRNF